MTYRTVKTFMDKLTPEQLDMDCSVNIDGEYFEISNIIIIDEDDVLDKDHPVFII
jgi:hypothetical protein